MSFLKHAIAFVVVVALLFFVLWGVCEIIYAIFNIESDGTRKGIRWTVLIILIGLTTWVSRGRDES